MKVAGFRQFQKTIYTNLFYFIEPTLCPGNPEMFHIQLEESFKYIYKIYPESSQLSVLLISAHSHTFICL